MEVDPQLEAQVIPQTLKIRVLATLAGGAIAIAAVTVNWFEGTRYTPYRDIGGVWTVCEGITGRDVVPNKRYTPGECATLKNRALVAADADVSRLVKVPITDTERAALIDFVYNVGAPKLASSTLLRKLNAGDHAGACAEYKRWVYAAGQKLRGLETRREVSGWLCSINLQ